MTLKPDPWQKEVLEYEDDLLIAKGRRIGATHIMGVKAIEYLMKHHNNHPSSQIVCVSITEDQAQLIILFALQYAQEKYSKFIGRGKDKPTLNRVILKVNGNKRILIAKPVGATGDSIRGFEGQVLMVDEASKMPKLFWAAAKPILLTTGGKIWMWSTFFGTNEYFWKSFDEAYNKKDPKARFKVWLKNSEEVMRDREISESWTQQQREEAIELLAEEKRDMTAAEYNQEYMAIPSDKIRQFFPDDLIAKCCVLKRGPRFNNRNYFLGVDVARMGEDESTFEIIDRTNITQIQHVENIITTKQLTTQTTQKIINLNQQYDFRKIYVDAAGVGAGVFDQLLIEDSTRRKTIPINNASKPLDIDKKRKQKILKEDLYNNLKRLMERGEIKLLDDDEVKMSLKSIQFEYTDNKVLKISGRYSHVSEGLIRAAWSAKDKHLKLYAY